MLVLDMEWHTVGWGSYDWERDLFPDSAQFLKRMRAEGVKVACNLHPSQGVRRDGSQFPAMAKAVGLPQEADKVPFDCTSPEYMAAMFRECLHPHEDAGVDVWWLDWQQGSESGLAGLDPLPWLNHLHWQDQQLRRPQRATLELLPLRRTRRGGERRWAFQAISKALGEA